MSVICVASAGSAINGKNRERKFRAALALVEQGLKNLVGASSREERRLRGVRR